MTKMRWLALGVMAVGVMLFSGTSDAATLVVNKSFPDVVTSTQFQKITAAVGAAQDGDTIEVAPGDYDEAVTITNKGIILKGSGPQYTTLLKTVTIKTTSVSPLNVSISGFTITAHGPAISVATSISSAVTISNNVISGSSGNGIDGSAYPLSIINNTIVGNQSGIYSTNSNGDYSVSAVNNIIYGNRDYALFVRNPGTFVTNNFFYANNINKTPDVTSCGANCQDNKSGNLNTLNNRDPLFLDANSNYVLKKDSPCRNAGQIGAAHLNPDGSQNDIGAYGGPGAASFWPYGFGPIVTGISATPSRVEKGGSITINATATAR